MWKKTIIVAFIVIVISKYFSKYENAEIPTLPNTYWGPGKPTEDPIQVNPFKIDIPEKVIEDLNVRLNRTRQLVDPLEGVKWSYGMPSTSVNFILNYWKNNYDWSKRQKLLNKYPQYTTIIQGLEIHFYHVKPKLPADRKIQILPILLVHGWPGSVVEFQKIIPLLTNLKHDRDFVFELVIPSLPGYGFSKPSVRPGLGPTQISVVFKNLMLRLGFEKFYVQGGDWGAVVIANLAALFPKHVIGAHSNMCHALDPVSLLWTAIENLLPSVIANREYKTRMYPLSKYLSFLIEETGYMHIQATKPDTVGTSLSDSPVGLATYLIEKLMAGTIPNSTDREDGGLLDKFTMDELIDNVMIYWLTNSIVTSQRIYAEFLNTTNYYAGYEEIPIQVPSACSIFPNEIIYQSESVLKRKYTNIIQFTFHPRGGHNAAFEEPDLLANDIWSFVHKVEHNLSL